MKVLFFKSSTGELINLAHTIAIYPVTNGEGIRTTQFVCDDGTIRNIPDPISVIENFLLKVQEVL